MNNFAFDTLKAYQRAHRDGFAENLGLRVHRALSWLQRAELSGEDADGRFIFLWIAFNAAYANDSGRMLSIAESRQFEYFWNKLCGMDADNVLYELVWDRYPQSVRLLLNNRYVFQPFWDHQAAQPQAADWELRFKRHQAAANRALGAMDTPRLLCIIFTALYTLRNQLIHGGATWASRVNREQVELGSQILGDIVPVVIDLMMRNPEESWGNPCYPIVD